ncbi:MAG TPA: radical SAM family heme chaperone HemW [Terriglobales bacterium]|jgi:oxygen-independent coproporphyrinogen-3 oxidase|nr:radical SAM family heme chaperone HemW [Terriglobales bacterium]
MPLGIYISVPFCRSKCSYCNFASGVFAREKMTDYVERLCVDIECAEQIAAEVGGVLERAVDSVYLGGGTPTTLAAAQLLRVFETLRRNFQIAEDAEITVECAPGTLSPEMLDTLLRCGVNRVSLGVQSFVDQESAAVGRLHSRAVVLDDIARLHAAGITNINIDLIAGLPHQTAESWRRSLVETIAAAVPHVSVYMLEVDEDSRLGRELIAGGTRYHAHFVPDDDLTADLYSEACAELEAAGIAQYEISNFARRGMESRHNLKYWTRQPYMGFGLDAHAMLPAAAREFDAVRFATADELESYTAGAPVTVTPVSKSAAMEEALFLGLRLTRGVDLSQLRAGFGEGAAGAFQTAIAELIQLGLMEADGGVLRLSAKGRLVSNEVFQRFIGVDTGLLALSMR